MKGYLTFLATLNSEQCVKLVTEPSLNVYEKDRGVGFICVTNESLPQLPNWN